MPNYVTKGGLENMKQELQGLKRQRHTLAEKLQRAISAGDLSENADYQEAKEEQAFLEGRISDLEQSIASAVVIEERRGGSTVRVGSTIVVERIGAGRKKETIFTIVGSGEADPGGGKISHISPLGAALLGRKSGDKVEFSTPNGTAKWYIRTVR